MRTVQIKQKERQKSMNDLIHIWLIVCPLVFLGGLIDAVAGGGVHQPRVEGVDDDRRPARPHGVRHQ